MLYWSTITLGPFVLLVVICGGEQIASASEGIPFLGWFVRLLDFAGSFIVAVLLLGSLYTLMPNTRVKFRFALAGAVVALPVWLLAKWGFAQYVQQVGTHSIYGALALIPLFLMWLNLSWWIFLFGAELAHTGASLYLTKPATK